MKPLKKIYLTQKQLDTTGEVFYWGDKIYRGIYHNAKDSVEKLLDSGLLDELIKNNLFPETIISKHIDETYAFILEHKKIFPITYSDEWSPSMLKDAALAVLDVEIIANKYGYTLSDCHTKNVLFDCCYPKFVDLGSFKKCFNEVAGWAIYKKFLLTYYFPLKMHRHGMRNMPKLISLGGDYQELLREVYIYKYWLLRSLSTEIIDKLLRIRYLYADIASIDNIDDLLKRRGIISNVNVAFCIKSIKKIIDSFKFAINQDINTLKKEVLKIRLNKDKTKWKNYHKSGVEEKRFKSIISLIGRYFSDAKTAIDMAGNQGLFSKLLLSLGVVEKVICADVDVEAIDIGYVMSRQTELKVSYVNCNAMKHVFSERLSFEKRFKSDIVIILALLHELILLKGYRIEYILNKFAKLTNNYICIEFVPIGVWTPNGNFQIPKWYTVDWFRKNLNSYFDILYEEQPSKNGIVFFGKKRNEN